MWMQIQIAFGKMTSGLKTRPQSSHDCGKDLYSLRTPDLSSNIQKKFATTEASANPCTVQSRPQMWTYGRESAYDTQGWLTTNSLAGYQLLQFKHVGNPNTRSWHTRVHILRIVRPTSPRRRSCRRNNTTPTPAPRKQPQ